MNEQNMKTFTWSKTRISELLGLGLMQPTEDQGERSRRLVARLVEDRAGTHLSAVLRDLQTPLDADQQGPLSLSRLLHLGRDPSRELHGRSYRVRSRNMATLGAG
ncbi:MAG: hypothetical protein GXY83_27805 [Rhodopirellula sp.]|nr:hypothetical protein [Rhodopirellula sp.]